MKQTLYQAGRHGCRTRLLISLITAFCAPLILFTGGCGKTEASAPMRVSRPVKVHAVAGTTALDPISLPGRTRAGRRAELAFKVAGPLVELPVKEGQAVRRGQRIARILPRDFRVDLDRAKATALEAEHNYDRYQKLYTRRQVSRAEFDRYKAARDVARSQLENARNALSDTWLKAPFAGVVARRHVENHQEVQAKQPIVSLQDIFSIEILVDVPETLMARFHKGAQENVVARFAVAPERVFPLMLKAYSAEADPRTQTYQVVLEMARPEGIHILPGMTATVEKVSGFPAGEGSRVIIPAIAVTEESGKQPFVWVLDPEKMTVKKVAVRLGGFTGADGMIIREGLSGGEKVVTAGVTKLQENMKVSIWDASH